MEKKSDDRKTIVGKIHPDVLAFTVGDDPRRDLELAVWDCLGTAAHVTMLARMRTDPPVLTPDERDRVVAALAGLIREARAGRFTITEADQDVHLAVERRLTESLGPLGRKVHTGRSRNDQVAVDIRLHARDQLLSLTLEAADLAEALERFGRRHRKLPMVGRTHLQPAMPSSVGVWATAYAEGILDDLPLVEAAYILTDLCPLGSAAGYGVPLPIDRALTARLLAFPRPLHNVMHASNARGKNEAVILAACAQIMITLSRLAEDLILFSLPEFGYFALPPDLCTGSSIMPQKRNPDVLELIRAKAALATGRAAAANALLTAMPGGYNRDLQDTKALYLDGIRETRASLRILSLLVPALEVRPERLRAAFLPGVFATDRALSLVAAGTPFRDAYQHVREHLAELEAADPDAAIAAKTHEGAPAGIDFSFYTEKIRNVRRWARQRRGRALRAFQNLIGPDFTQGAQ